MKRIVAALVNKADVVALQRYLPARQSRMWGNTSGIPRRFKDELTTDLLPKQSHRCAYCCSRLLGAEPHRDHIAPKGINLDPEFTFEVRNLVLACYYCNSERKGETDTIAVKAPQYELCQFEIVHPILDEPTEHLRYIGHRLKVLVQAVDGSQKGQRTIDLFDLASPDRCKMRTKDLWFDRDLEHLHGKWKHLFEQLIFAPLPQQLVMKLRP